MTQAASNASGPIQPELLGRLVDTHAAALVLYARQWCDAPEDIVQEALIELARQAALPPNPAAWLYRAVRNRSISSARQSRRRQRHETVAAHQRAAWFTTSPADALDAQAAAAALAELDHDQREVVVAHLWGKLTFEQIGELAGTSASTAYRRYVAALSTLRERLGVSCPKNR